MLPVPTNVPVPINVPVPTYTNVPYKAGKQEIKKRYLVDSGSYEQVKIC